MPDNMTFLFAAFAITWLLILGYFLFVGGRIGALSQDVEILREELAERTTEQRD
jgi:CcmD family protein